jgi:agmatinase
MTPTLVGIPFDAKSSFLRGAAAGPTAIRAALHSSSTNLWTETLLDLGAAGALGDAGDIEITDHGFLDEIERGVRGVIAAGGRAIALGGDHSITYPTLRATAPAYPGLTILHFDAHADLYPAFEGDRFSHACPFARIMEDRLASALVQVGIRTLNHIQRTQADRFGVEVIDMRRWAAGERPGVRGPVYLSIDLDVFDPGFAPGVSHREPGGLAPRDVISLIQSIHGPLIGADIVELNPARDPAEITAPLAAKLVKELAAKMIETHTMPTMHHGE